MTSDPFNAAALSARQASSGQSMAAALEATRSQHTSNAQESRAVSQVSESSPSKTGADSGAPGESAEQVAQAVGRLNEMMQNERQTLRFAVDDDSGRMVVRVMDAQTDEVIRQIPSEETLRFAEYVDGLVGMIFNNKA